MLGQTSAAILLAGADAATDAGDLKFAGLLYDRVTREFPDSAEAVHARRALKIIAARRRQPQIPSATPVPPPGEIPTKPGDEVVIRHEPYSIRTTERLRLTTWEKLDFGVTSFLYGMSVGFSYAIGANDIGSATMPIALGALAYTLGAVVYLRTADPDRGDLPLALAITSYIPTTTLLLANIAYDNPDEEKTSLAVVGAGLISIPIAIAATAKLDLDPGDTQLVRDAGYWGLVLGTAGTMAFGGSTVSFGAGFESYQSPSARAVAGMGMVGMYGGLGLGILAATQSEVSLERVRVTTWGGYGGGVLGTLMGLGLDSNSEESVYRGLTIGALAGLIITFASTGSLDGIPADDAPARRAAGPRLTPTLLPMAGANGRSLPMFGFAGALP